MTGGLLNYFKASEAVKVTLGLTIHELIEVNMEQNSVTAVLWFNYNWNDPLLSWKNKKKYAEVGLLAQGWS